MNPSKILFLGKSGDPHGQQAFEFLKLNFKHIDHFVSTWGEPMPAAVANWQGDLIISYLSRWVLPADLLKRAKLAAINFHPASPDYPGIGCINFALYEGAKLYGSTCHHMSEQVDTGKIIDKVLFPIYKSDTVATLLERTYTHQLGLFYRVMDHFLANGRFPLDSSGWGRAPISRKEFNELTKISADMPKDEIERRLRATTFGSFRPTVTVAGHEFVLK